VSSLVRADAPMGTAAPHGKGLQGAMGRPAQGPSRAAAEDALDATMLLLPGSDGGSSTAARAGALGAANPHLPPCIKVTRYHPCLVSAFAPPTSFQVYLEQHIEGR
jgi:hypothetical protein